MNPVHLVRATDPMSSVMAAERVQEFAPNQYERILAAMKNVATSESGATPAEIGEEAGLTMVQVDRRMKELCESGFVYVVQRGGGDLTRGRMRCWALVGS